MFRELDTADDLGGEHRPERGDFVHQAALRDYARCAGGQEALTPDHRSAERRRLPTTGVAPEGQAGGISEIRIQHDDDTYRVYFAAEYERRFTFSTLASRNPKKDEIAQCR